VLAPHVEAFRHFHVLFRFHVSLGMGEHKVKLARVPTLKDGECEAHTNRRPLHDRGMSLPAVHTMLLFPSVDVEASLVLVNFPSVDTPFPLHCPN
jgi:hypothetical protein